VNEGRKLDVICLLFGKMGGVSDTHLLAMIFLSKSLSTRLWNS
jgi:hypothetical protein